MPRFNRRDALPKEMQGQWIDPADGSTLSVIDGDVCFQGVAIRHDWFDVETIDGSLCVDFGVNDPSRIDGFVKENLTHLVVDPEGNFHGYNTKFGCTFVRSETNAND